MQMKCRSLFAPGGGSQPFSGGEMCAWIEDAGKTDEARTTEERERERRDEWKENGGVYLKVKHFYLPEAQYDFRSVNKVTRKEGIVRT